MPNRDSSPKAKSPEQTLLRKALTSSSVISSAKPLISADVLSATFSNEEIRQLLSAPLETKLSVQVVTDFKRFMGLREEWDDLFLRTTASTTNHDHRWLACWLQHFAWDLLSVVLVRDEQDRLIAAAPLKISRYERGFAQKGLKHLQFIGTEPTLYEQMKVLIDQEQVEAGRFSEIMTLIGKTILQAKNHWDILDLRFCIEHEQAFFFKAFFKSSKVPFALTTQMSYSSTTLEKSLELYIQNHKNNSRKYRNMMNRLKKAFPGETIEVRALNNDPHVEDRLDQFFEWNLETWKENYQKCDLLRYPESKSFYKSLIKAYQTPSKVPVSLCFWGLLAGHEALALKIDLVNSSGYQGSVSINNPAHSNLSPGFMMHELTVRHAVEEGAKIFSFGRGDEDYKKRWCKDFTPLWDMVAFSNPLAQIRWSIDQQLKKIIQ